MQDANNRRTSTVYDKDSRAVASINPLGKRSTTVYDARDRLHRQIDGEGDTTTWEYLPAGQVRSVEDPRQHVTRSEYDVRGLLTTYVEADDDPDVRRTTTYLYDAAGDLASQTEGIAPGTLYAHRVRTDYR